jgi:hypothetical protein
MHWSTQAVPRPLGALRTGPALVRPLMCFELRIALISNLILQVFSKDPEAVLNTPNTLFTYSCNSVVISKSRSLYGKVRRIDPRSWKDGYPFSGMEGNLLSQYLSS